ncbi:MAG: YggT family protein [Nitrospiraceae bacterium]|nr:YggT family protein [Nitrospiraceae bacterium]
MFIASNFLSAVASILDWALSVYTWIIIAAALISWVSPDPYNPIVRFLYRVTDPVLRPIRRLTGAIGGIDISPLIAILIIWFIRRFLIVTLLDIAVRIR